MVNFTIQGKPQGKGRPRVTSHGTYTPEKTKQYEELVKWCYVSQVGKSICGVPLSVNISAYFKAPKKSLIGQPHTKKPDADNIAKAILDALNGVAYIDDSCVSDLRIEKIYGENEKVEVMIDDTHLVHGSYDG